MKLNYLTLQYDAASLASYVGAGTSLLGDVFNLFGSSQANREQRNWAVTQQQQQRDWALEDIKNQNIYNSPVEQMNRLKQAGLNPNMVYGTGVTGSTGQQQQQPRASIAPPYQPRNPLGEAFGNIGAQVASAIATYNSITETQAQIKNLGQTYTGLGLDNARKTIENVIIGSEGRSDPNMKEFYQWADQNVTGYNEKLQGNVARASEVKPLQASLEYNNIRDENTRAWAKNAREEALNKPTVQGAIQSVANAVETNALIRQQTQVGAAQWQEIMQKTAQMGQNMSDPKVQQTASDLVDYLILALTLKNKGGTPKTSPMPGYPTQNPMSPKKFDYNVGPTENTWKY